ncbi:UNVERIFIED_CONTAM: protein SPIRRIG [Sesamum radiatum]|uniref:Protein SPIRRIG n=1 Tax=Sesamum radiatum TaxID=300843 RepID=A0AAW2UR56_SESRA
MKAAAVVETVLESVPLYADAESVLVFQGLCLTRLMNFLERRLLRDDEEDEKKLDKARWSSNLDALSWMIVDRMYMGAFPQPAGILKTLEFLLSMLQLANKDGRIEETIPTGKGLLSIGLHLKSFLSLSQTKGLHWMFLHGGFDKLLTGNLSGFFEWFNNSESVVSKVLEQCAAIMWVQYITGSAKFPGVRIKGMDSRRKREVGRKSRTSQNWSKDIGIRCLFNILTGKSKDESFNAELYDESTFKESDDARDIAFSGVGWNDDRESSINEASLHSATEFGVKSSAASTHRAESIRGKSELGSPRQSSSLRTDEVRISEDKTDKELNDNGEYLIRPYLEPFERIKYKYNCERVESEDELSIIDQALGVKKDFSCSMDSHSKSTSSWGAAVKAYAGGRAWAYNGGAWGKEKVASSSNVPHLWRIWKLDSVHELLKRDYQLRPVAIEIF